MSKTHQTVLESTLEALMLGTSAVGHELIMLPQEPSIPMIHQSTPF